MGETRTYRGLSARERIHERRERLLAAALEQFGTRGFSGTTIDALCAEAKISTRAFYECFEGREHVLRAVYEQILEEAMRTVLLALDEADDTLGDRIQAGLAAYIGFLTRDPRRARIVHVEVRRTGDTLQPDRRRAVYLFADLVAAEVQNRTPPPGMDFRHVAIGLMGAVQELIIDWVRNGHHPSPDRLLTTANHLFLTTLEA